VRFSQTESTLIQTSLILALEQAEVCEPTDFQIFGDTPVTRTDLSRSPSSQRFDPRLGYLERS